jgi:DNA-binding MarR family transcriptional regulator
MSNMNDNHIDIDKLVISLKKIQSIVSPFEFGGHPVIAVERELKLRRARDNIFPAGYFADAAWEALLELYHARLKGIPISVSALGLSGNIPMTTMLRYLDRLSIDGFVFRHADARDKRRVFVELTDMGMESMAKLFGSTNSLYNAQ